MNDCSIVIIASLLNVSANIFKRGLTINTIESHLASFIPEGDIDVLEIIPLKTLR